MNTTLRIIACALFLAALLPASPVSAQADKLVGVWKLTEIKYPEMPDKNLPVRNIANPNPSIYIFTNKHFSRVSDGFYKPRTDLPQTPTDEQLVAAWRRFSADAGTYEVEGNKITAHIIVAKNPNAMNSNEPLIIEFRFDGDTLVFLGRSPIYDPMELKFTRLE